jgi:hypothetical protein
VFNSIRSHPTRAHAVAEAKTRGYSDGATEVDIDETFVNLKALREDE